MTDFGLFLRAIAKVLLVTGIGPFTIVSFLVWKFLQVGAGERRKRQSSFEVNLQHSLVDFEAHEPAPLPSRKAA